MLICCLFLLQQQQVQGTKQGSKKGWGIPTPSYKILFLFSDPARLSVSE